MENKQLWNMFTSMKLNTDAMIDKDFNKSIKFVVDEYIENDCPKVFEA